MSKIQDAIAYGAKAAALRDEVNASDDMTADTEHLALIAAFYGLLSRKLAAEAGEAGEAAEED